MTHPHFARQSQRLSAGAQWGNHFAWSSLDWIETHGATVCFAQNVCLCLRARLRRRLSTCVRLRARVGAFYSRVFIHKYRLGRPEDDIEPFVTIYIYLGCAWRDLLPKLFHVIHAAATTALVDVGLDLFAIPLDGQSRKKHISTKGADHPSQFRGLVVILSVCFVLWCARANQM